MAEALKVLVKSWQEALEAVNGRAYTLDGVHGHIKVRTHAGRTTVYHEASPRGRTSKPYLETNRKLRYDWDTDLTMSERLPVIMYELGIDFERSAA